MNWLRRIFQHECEKCKILRCKTNERSYWICSKCLRGWHTEKEKTVKEALAECKDVIDIQLTDPASKTDPYMRGLANGIIFLKASLLNEEPNYISKPKRNSHRP